MPRFSERVGAVEPNRVIQVDSMNDDFSGLRFDARVVTVESDATVGIDFVLK